MRPQKYPHALSTTLEPALHQSALQPCNHRAAAAPMRNLSSDVQILAATRRASPTSNTNVERCSRVSIADSISGQPDSPSQLMTSSPPDLTATGLHPSTVVASSDLSRSWATFPNIP